MEKTYKDGGWVFLSHSHKDIQIARKIRNSLEGMGFEPLLFYLKCLSDECEVEELIKREIAAREWFVYVDSPNARESRWVRTERDYIELFKDKRVLIINTDTSKESISSQIEHLARQMKVFISFSMKDIEIVRRLEKKLVAKDLLILSSENIKVGPASFLQRIDSQIVESSKNGFVLVILTESSVNDQYVLSEVMKAIESGGITVPVFVGDTVLSESLMLLLGKFQGIHININPTDEELDSIVNDILTRVKYYKSDFTTSYGFRNAETIYLPAISRIDSDTFWDNPFLKCVYVPNTVIYIASDAFDDYPDILIKCYPESYTERYCQKQGIKYELITTDKFE